MPSILLSLISSGSVKWIAIVLMVFGLAGGLYWQHRKIVEHEKAIALQEYNINQLQQNIKDRELFLKQMQEISNHKSQIVADLYIEQDRLEEKIQTIMKSIEDSVKKGHDRASSKILRDTFKALGELQ